MGLDTKTYWLTDRQSQCDFDFDIQEFSSVQLFSRKRIQKAVQKLSVQPWGVNQQTTEAEEVTDS
jgi:hypothetical protein